MVTLEGFIKSGTVPDFSMEELELKFRNYGKTKNLVIGKTVMPFPLDNPVTHLTLTWDNTWRVDVMLINISTDVTFRQEADDYAKNVAKENPQKAQIIQNADRVLRVNMGDDPNDDYLSSTGIILTETLEEWTGCVFVNPKSKNLF